MCTKFIIIYGNLEYFVIKEYVCIIPICVIYNKKFWFNTYTFYPIGWYNIDKVFSYELKVRRVLNYSIYWYEIRVEEYFLRACAKTPDESLLCATPLSTERRGPEAHLINWVIFSISPMSHSQDLWAFSSHSCYTIHIICI